MVSVVVGVPFVVLIEKALLVLFLLGLESIDISHNQGVQLGLELRAVAKEEQDFVDHKVRGKDKG